MLASRRHILSFVFLFSTTAFFGFAQEKKAPEPTTPEAIKARWEKDIAALEELDKSEIAGEKSVLFLGSSSIRRWESMAKDMEPWPVVRRGYGGAKFSDLVFFTERLMAAHSPRAVVVYVGNDITGNEKTDKSPEEVVKLFSQVVGDIHHKKPDAEVFVIGITPAPKRFAAWPTIQKANDLLKKYCSQNKRLHFIETAAAYLTSDGQPRPELYVDDKLHQNAAGYQLWSGIIRQELEKVFGSPTGS